MYQKGMFVSSIDEMLFARGVSIFGALVPPSPSDTAVFLVFIRARTIESSCSSYA